MDVSDYTLLDGTPSPGGSFSSAGVKSDSRNLQQRSDSLTRYSRRNSSRSRLQKVSFDESLSLLQSRKKRMAGEDDVCIGDIVCFHSEDTRGFIFSLQSSSLHNELAVDSNQSDRRPSIQSSPSILFQICAQNRYKANKKLPKIREKIETDPLNIATRTQLTRAKKAAHAEDKENEQEQKRQQGKPVYYGQIIQLRHILTEKCIHVNTTQTSWTETSNLLVELLKNDGKRAQFRILPRYKVKSEGDLVQVNDLIIFESVKSQGQYLHSSRTTFQSNSVYNENHEINLSVIPGGFSIIRYRSGNSNDTNKIRGGSVIQLFHKEMEGYVSAGGVFGRQLDDNVHLRLRPISTQRPKSLRAPTSAITCWRIEKEASILNGSDLNWEEHVRLQHVTTRQYLMIDQSLNITLTIDRNNPLSVFRLHPVAKRGHSVTHQSYLRVQHVISGAWLHGNRNRVYKSLQSVSPDLDGTNSSMKQLQWSQAALRTLEACSEMMYDDAYTVLLIEPSHLHDIQYVAGMVPFLINLRSQLKEWDSTTARAATRVERALMELKDFMIVNGGPNKNRQKLLRDFKILDIMVELLRIPSKDAKSKEFVQSVHAECYAIIQVYLQGFSPKNELYLAKHFDFFQAQLLHWDTVGLHAAHMLMELLKDNRTIIDLVNHQQIDMFIHLITKNKNYRYLELLSVLCIASEVALSENQSYIAQKWIETYPGENYNVLDYLAMGESIGLEQDIPYISTDLRKTWSPLTEFFEQKDSKDIKFLEYQLRLFSAVSYGRNTFSSSLITDTGKVYSWEVALHMLQNDAIPDELRAVAATNIRDLFIHSGMNYSIMDRVHMVFDYEKISKTQIKRLTRGESIMSGCQALPFIGPLKRWIRGFFEQNACMIASEIARNQLTSRVLNLVHNLVNFGYYGDTEDIRKLLEPMLSLMNGKNDKPFPMKEDSVVLTSEVREELDKFRNDKRFKKNRENEAITDAKYEAMKVIDLFLNFRFTTRLNRFIAEFKSVESNTADELHSFVQEQESSKTFRNNPNNHKNACKRLHEIFKETEYFGASFIEVLKDLLNYGQEKIVTESLVLLNRYYSAHEDLFNKCIATQIFVTEESLTAMKLINDQMPKLKLLKMNNWSDENIVEEIVDILKDFIRLCSLENLREPHAINQEMLFNYDIFTEILDILSNFTARKTSQDEKDAKDKEILRYSFRLLKALARGNESVQNRLVSHLDYFLSITGAPSELGEFLSELFKGNVGNSLKIEPNSIQTVVKLYSDSFHPVWISLLSTLVVAEVFPIKRNQSLVIKGLMTYQKSLSIITDTDSQTKVDILKGELPGDKRGIYDKRHQFACLVYLFSMCSMGENKSNESICQCLLSMDQLLNYITMPQLCHGLLLPFVNFLTTGYMHSFSSTARTEISKFGKDRRLLKFLNSIVGILQKAIEIVETNSNAIDLLRARPANLHRSRSDTVHENKETLHFIFDGILPFLYAIFERHYNSAIMLPYETVSNILDHLAHFGVSVQHCLSRMYHRTQLLNTLRLISHTVGIPINVPQELASKVQNESSARQAYNRKYHEELKVNGRFNAFANNMLTAYEGKNSVRQQISVPVDYEYSDQDSEEALPLGEEFQELLSMFLVGSPQMNKKERKYDIKGLLKHLGCSMDVWSRKAEKDARELENLDVRCLQILRAMIHNELVRLPKFKSSNPEQYMRVMKDVKTLQGNLDSQGLVKAVLPHLRRSNTSIVRECFNLLKVLYKGNSKTPDTFVKYILDQHEEAFFVAVQARLHSTASLIKEQRFIHTLHQRAIKNSNTLMRAANNVKPGHRDSIIHPFQAIQEKAGNTIKSIFLGKDDSVIEMEALEAAQKEVFMVLRAQQTQTETDADLVRSHHHKNDAEGKMITPAPPNSKTSGGRGNRIHNEQQEQASAGVNETSPTTESDRISKLNSNSSSTGDTGVKTIVEEQENGSIVRNGNLMVTPLKSSTGQNLLISGGNPNHKAVSNGAIAQQPGQMAREGFSIEAIEMECPDLSAYEDLGDVRVVLRTLQSLCDLEFSSAQELMREQPENVKSVNLVAEVTHLLSILYTNIDAELIELVSEILETLIEMVQGNNENQAVVFDNKTIDYLNHMLRTEDFPDCAYDDILRLKMSIGLLIKFLTEENQDQPNKPSQSRMILSAVNKDGLWQTALDSFKRSGDDSLTTEQKMEGLEMGFLYFCILKRAIDLNLDTEATYESAAWKFYSDRSMCLEMVKGGMLQRIHFRVTDAKALRKEVEEKLSWEVDRTSHGNKMRDFMSWIKDIHDDILFQRQIHSNPMGRFFVRHWKPFNYTVLALTMLINLMMLIIWEENIHREDSTEVNPKPLIYVDFWLYHHSNLDIMWRLAGGVHNIASFGLVVSYFLSNAAGFYSSQRSFLRKFKKFKGLIQTKDTIDPNDRPSKLEVNIIGIQPIYYMLFFGLSVTGTIVSPCFFAFHLLQIVANNQLLTRVIRAVTVNGKSLLWVAFLGVVIIYIYGLVAFLALRSIYKENTHFCKTLWQCTLSTMREGLIYRMMRIDYPIKRQELSESCSVANSSSFITDNNDFNVYGFKLLWDISFFVLILTIGLNVIFGIIVDTFRQLRDAKWRIEQDMESRCFVCGRNSYEFEQKGISFRYHCTVEHNMLSYVFFYVRLQDLPTEDLSHLEMYIKKMIKTEDFNFFPLNRAMSLLDKEGEERELERDILLMKQMEHIMKKMDEDDWMREKAILRKQQEEWEREYRMSAGHHHSHHAKSSSVFTTPIASSSQHQFGGSSSRSRSSTTIVTDYNSVNKQPLAGIMKSTTSTAAASRGSESTIVAHDGAGGGHGHSTVVSASGHGHSAGDRSMPDTLLTNLSSPEGVRSRSESPLKGMSGAERSSASPVRPSTAAFKPMKHYRKTSK